MYLNKFLLLYTKVMTIRILLLYMYCTIILYVLYIYIYIIFYNFHLIIRLKYNFHTIIWITQLILFISWNYIHINTLYSLTNTHNLTNTHTQSHKLTQYLLISWNCLILCKIHFLNVNIVIESTFCRKATVWKKIVHLVYFCMVKITNMISKKLDISLTQSLEWKLIIFVACIKFI